MGWLAVGFGVLGIFTNGTIFVPLAFICSVVALFMGQGAWAFGGLLLSVIGLLTSPVLLALLGLGALAAYFGLPM
jgi:multisubunit Na+/H+ antiporter MnhG subunit